VARKVNLVGRDPTMAVNWPAGRAKRGSAVCNRRVVRASEENLGSFTVTGEPVAQAGKKLVLQEVFGENLITVSIRRLLVR